MCSQSKQDQNEGANFSRLPDQETERRTPWRATRGLDLNSLALIALRLDSVSFPPTLAKKLKSRRTWREPALRLGGLKHKSVVRSVVGGFMGLRDELRKTASAVSGGKKTDVARLRHVSNFAKFLKDQNIRIEKIEHVKARHIKDFAASRLAAGIGKRTIQNEIGSLRVVLEKAGRGQLAGLVEISNKNLGLSGASRAGTKTAMAGERFRELIGGIKSPGVAAAVRLADGIGLRAEEARQSDLATLKSWEKILEKGSGKIYIIRGAKNGRERWTNPADKARALAAVKGAIRVIESSGSRFLISGTLKQAENKYKNELTKAGFIGRESGHSLRYAYAHRQFENYKSQGLSDRDALVSLSRDLGHGDGRGRYCKSVYLR